VNGQLRCTMLPFRLWIHFPPIAVCTLYHVTSEVVDSLPTHSSVYSVPYTLLWVGSESTTSMVTWYRVHLVMYYVTIEVVNSLPTHSSVYSVPCYH
jgi:hypothetical protein